MTRSDAPSLVDKPISTRLSPAANGSLPSLCTHTIFVGVPVNLCSSAAAPTRSSTVCGAPAQADVNTASTAIDRSASTLRENWIIVPARSYQLPTGG
jgi:hypothetical protein